MDISIIATLANFIGHGFSIYKSKWCFLIWILGSLIWIFYGTFLTWQPSLTVNSVISIAFSLTAYLNWSRIERNVGISKE